MPSPTFELASIVGIVVRGMPIVLAILVPVGVVLFAWRSRHGPRADAARTTAIEIGVATWVALILLMTVVPFGQSDDQPPIALIPFVDATWRVVNGERYLSSEVTDVVLNVIVFMPLGIGAALRWGRRWMIPSIAAAAALSFGIELTQALEATGRFASATDVVTNTTGAALGFLLGVRWRGGGGAPAYDRPTFERVPTADDRPDR
jgi:glycopeptide antibiotics resistance protein